MEKNQYDFASLSSTDLQSVYNLEKKLSEDKGEEVILIAYHDPNKK